ncbi:hypothetical protein [uncultured Aquimarina sp.]|uniref:hypothetical protein n=1 Tax=uncultured Aquimarina sp. TaxID=575652 RepID=UPI0026388D96|nr:hypothetical protein [uncultured Aquimarina sp.]
MSYPKYIIPSNLSEPQIEADISNYFGLVSAQNTRRFRLITTNEQLTGADKKFVGNNGFLIYLQFKASEGMKTVNSYPVSSRKNRSKREDIREYRHNQKINENHILYFKLRKQAKTAIDLQHNILLKHANKVQSQAMYVANLELDKDKYYDKQYRSAQGIEHPFYWLEHPRVPFEQLTSLIGMTPFLKEHISIVPDKAVTDDNHYYSYSPLGENVIFHSPYKVNEHALKLSDRLKIILNEMYYESKNEFSIQSLSEYVNELSEQIFVDKNEKTSFNDNNPIDTILDYGRRLYEEYNILQILIIR